MAEDQVQAAGEPKQKDARKNTKPAVRKGKAVSKAKEPGRQVAISHPAPVTIDQQIILASRDPAVDVGKMRALTELRAEMRMEEAKEAFNIALSQAQSEMRPIEADANNPSTKSKYATLFAVDKALRPIYSAHGLGISFNTADCPLPGHTRVIAYVSRGLYVREYQYDVAIDPKGPKGNDVMNKTHAGGSALSYGKRYLLQMIFNVTLDRSGTRGGDDDGNAAGGADVITKKQASELVRLISDAGVSIDKFCAAFNIDAVADLPVGDYELAKSRIEKAKKERMRRETASDFPGDRPL